MRPSVAVFPGTRQLAWLGVIVGIHCCYNGNRGNCWNTLLLNIGNRGHCWKTLMQQRELRSLFGLGTEVIVASQKWPLITLSQQLPWIPLLSLLFLSRKSDLSTLFLWAVVFNEETCWRHRPCCGVMNTFGISVYAKQYTFPILLYVKRDSKRATKSMYFLLNNVVRYTCTTRCTLRQAIYLLHV
jgi:hypothetical protein